MSERRSKLRGIAFVRYETLTLVFEELAERLDLASHGSPRRHAQVSRPLLNIDDRCTELGVDLGHEIGIRHLGVGEHADQVHGILERISILEKRFFVNSIEDDRAVDKQIRFAFGFQHDLSDALTLGASFVYVNLGRGEVRNANVSGKYKDNDLFVLGLMLSFKQLPWRGKLTL